LYHAGMGSSKRAANRSLPRGHSHRRVCTLTDLATRGRSSASSCPRAGQPRLVAAALGPNGLHACVSGRRHEP